jgi:Carbohydrate binding domain
VRNGIGEPGASAQASPVRGRPSRRTWSRIEAVLAVSLVVLFGIAVAVGKLQKGRHASLVHSFAGNLIVNRTFSEPLSPWVPYPTTRAGRVRGRVGEVRLEATRHTTYGILQSGIVNPVQGETYEFSAWLRGSASTLGKRVTVELDEQKFDAAVTGGPMQRFAKTKARFSRGWRKVVARGRVRQTDVTLNAYIFVEHNIRPGDAFYAKKPRLVRLGSRDRSGK